MRKYLEQDDDIIEDPPLRVQSGVGERTTHPRAGSQRAAARRALLTFALVLVFVNGAVLVRIVDIAPPGGELSKDLCHDRWTGDHAFYSVEHAFG